MPDLPGKILSSRDNDNLVSARFANPRCLGCRRRHRDRERARKPSQLNAVQPEPAAGAGDQHPFPEPHPADVAHRVELGANGAGHDGGFLRRDTGGHLEGGVGIDADELGIAAIEPGIAEKNPLRT